MFSEYLLAFAKIWKKKKLSKEIVETLFILVLHRVKSRAIYDTAIGNYNNGGGRFRQKRCSKTIPTLYML